MKIRTKIKAGTLTCNHNGVKVKSNVRAGRDPQSGLPTGQSR